MLAAEVFPVGSGDPQLHEDQAHDVLAAEEFPVGAGDPELHEDQAHDVLAAEEFPVGDADPELHEEHALDAALTPTGGGGSERGITRVIAGLALAGAVFAALVGALRRLRAGG